MGPEIKLKMSYVSLKEIEHIRTEISECVSDDRVNTVWETFVSVIYRFVSYMHT